MAYVKLSSMPDARKIRTFEFPKLNGGLNLSEAEVNLQANESPDLLNVWFQDGVLQSRYGQEYVSAEVNAIGYAVSPEPFWDATFFHIGDALQYADTRDRDDDGHINFHSLLSDVPENRGTFTRFGDYLFYKNRGGFYRISYKNGVFSAVSLPDADDLFTPTVLINADPATGAGDLYQPENRLSAKKRVTFNASTAPETVIKNGDGVSRGFAMEVDGHILTAYDNLRGVKSVYINDAFTESALYEVDLNTGRVIFNSAPPEDSVITFTLNMGKTEYHLPAENIDSVVSVKVDGLEMTEGADYAVDAVTGIVTFTDAPPVTDPPQNNTVAITYSKANPEALSPLLDCPYLTSYGSGIRLCLVAGGCESQPNAVFWSGHTDIGLDATYWPFEHSNLVGDTMDRITGFGKQYGDLIVLKGRSVGKLSLTFETVNERETISLNYETVNPMIGCDLPLSPQVIENNLVFASTGGGNGGGVFLIQSASAAYENNLLRVSKKIDGSNEKPGLLYDLRVNNNAPVPSLDDGKRYWLAINKRVWVWDYSISDAANPVWFLFDGISNVAAFFQAHGAIYHLGVNGRVTQFGRFFDDYGAAIRKRYAFPTLNFGDYSRLKDVTELLISTRKDTPSDTEITYRTDYEARQDRVNLMAQGYDRLTERDLSERDLSVSIPVAAFRRKPFCRHVRHFQMILENNESGKDLSVLSAQIKYRFTGRER